MWSDVKLERGGEKNAVGRRRGEMWGRRRSTTTTKTTAVGIRGGGEGETARPLPTLYYHLPSLPTLCFLSPFLIIRYFVLYSQEMRRGMSLFFWSQSLNQVVFQGSQSLNEAIWAQIKSTFPFIFTQTPSEDLHDPLYYSMIYILLKEVWKEQKMVSLVLWKIWSHTNWRSTPT